MDAEKAVGRLLQKPRRKRKAWTMVAAVEVLKSGRIPDMSES